MSPFIPVRVLVAALALAGAAAASGLSRADLAAPFDGKPRAALPDAASVAAGHVERIVFRADSGFIWTIEAAGERAVRAGTWSREAADAGARLRLSYREYRGAAAGPAVERLCWWSWESGSDLLALVDQDGVIGLYSGDADLFVYRVNYAADTEAAVETAGGERRLAAANLGRPEFGWSYWAEARPGPGDGSRIRLAISPPWSELPPEAVAPELLFLMNGVAGSLPAWSRNPRVRELSIDGERGGDAQVLAADTWLPQLVTARGVTGETGFTVTVRATYQGSASEQLCLSKLWIIGRRARA